MSSAIKSLTDSPQNSRLTKRDVIQLNLSQNDEKIDKSDAVQILAVFGSR